MSKMRAIAIAQVISHHVVIASSLRIVSAEANVFTVEDIAGSRYLVTVEAMYADTDGPTMTEVWQKCPDRNVYTSAAEHARKCGAHFDSDKPEPDDDSDDDEITPDPENFDGGYGAGSWFQESMRKGD